MNGNVIDADYIVGVATEETHRRKGYMRILLISAMRQLYKENKSFVYLMPARESIYTPFDFTFIYKQPVMDLKPARVNDSADEFIIMSRQADVNDLVILTEFSNAVLREQFDVFAYRDKNYFENLLEETRIEDGQALLLYKGNELIGYAATAFSNDTANVNSSAHDNHLFIRELIVLPEYLEQVYHWLKRYFRYKSGKLLLSATKSPFYASEYRPIIMARIIHLEEMMKLIRIPENFCIRLQVADPILEGNNRKFLWAREWKMLPNSEPVDMVITIESLTSWLFGYKTLEKLLAEKSVYLYNDCREMLNRVGIIKKILLNEFV